MTNATLARGLVGVAWVGLVGTISGGGRRWGSWGRFHRGWAACWGRLHT